MTVTTEHHLDLILAFCRKNLALAEKRTPGLWRYARAMQSGFRLATTDLLKKGVLYVRDCDLTDDNGTFIAACAGAAEAGWHATIAALEGLQEMQKNVRGWRDDNGCCGAALQYIHSQFQSVLTAYPLDLIQ